MLPQDFKDWRERHKLTQADAAQVLGRSLRSVNAMENGPPDEPIAKETALACKAIDYESHQPDLVDALMGADTNRVHRPLKALLDEMRSRVRLPRNNKGPRGFLDLDPYDLRLRAIEEELEADGDVKRALLRLITELLEQHSRSK